MEEERRIVLECWIAWAQVMNAGPIYATGQGAKALDKPLIASIKYSPSRFQHCTVIKNSGSHRAQNRTAWQMSLALACLTSLASLSSRVSFNVSAMTTSPQCLCLPDPREQRTLKVSFSAGSIIYLHNARQKVLKLIAHLQFIQ